MKKINHVVLVLIGIMFTVIPIYRVLSWVIIYNKYSNHTHMEKVKIHYEKMIGYNWFEMQSPIPSLISILSGAFALICFSYSLKNKKSGIIFSGIKILLIVIASICTFLSLYSIM